MNSDLKWKVMYNSHLQCNWPELYYALTYLNDKGVLELKTQRRMVSSKLIKRLFWACEDLGDMVTRGTMKWALEKNKTTDELVSAILESPKNTLTSVISWWEDKNGEITRVDTKKKNIIYLIEGEGFNYDKISRKENNA